MSAQQEAPDRRRRNLRSLIVFGAIIIGFGVLCFVAADRLTYFRDEPIDFAALPDDAMFIEHGLTRRQSASVKLGFAENFEPPQVGLFGNHVFMYFGSGAFGSETQRNFFFNYWYANLGLPEIRDYLSHLASIDKLPTETILVQITTPNNDNGRYILGYNGELPPDLVKIGEEKEGDGSLERILHFAEAWRHELDFSVQYTTVMIGLLRGKESDRVLQMSQCADGAPAFEYPMRAIVDRLPVTIKNAFLPPDPRKYCNKEVYWNTGVTVDGSRHSQYTDERHLVIDENELREHDRDLDFGDETRIAAVMRNIAAIGAENGREVIFIIPPVYESDRRFSPVNQVFNRALESVPELHVVDHRSKRTERELFVNYDHPSELYFQKLVGELRTRGLIR